MKNYKKHVILVTKQYLTELINHNEEVNIRMFYSTFDDDQYISILNDQDQEVSFNFVNDSIEIELIDPLCEKILITFDTVEQTAKVHQVIKFLLDLFFNSIGMNQFQRYQLQISGN